MNKSICTRCRCCYLINEKLPAVDKIYCEICLKKIEKEIEELEIRDPKKHDILPGKRVREKAKGYKKMGWN